MEDLFLLQYDGIWYRTKDINKIAALTIQNFDMIVKVNGNDVIVLEGMHNGTSGGIDLLKMKLFVLGKSRADFPIFTPCTRQYASTDFVFDDSGNLFEQEINYSI